MRYAGLEHIEPQSIMYYVNNDGSLWSYTPQSVNVSGDDSTQFYIMTTYASLISGPGGEQVTEMAMNTTTSGSGVTNTMVWQHANVYAGGKLIATYDNDGLHFYLNDPLGTRRVQTDYAGVLEQTCSSLPFGDGLACTGSTTAPTEHHFTGKERDSESGNDYFGARYYASSMGRFMSPDPLGPWVADVSDPQSWNFYAYGRNNPLINIDPTGTDCVYFNDAGNGVESIDRQDSAQNSGTSLDRQSSDCGANGGDWINGHVTGSMYFADSDTFAFTSYDASNTYLTYAKAPGAEIDGTTCSGNCDVANGYFQNPIDKSWAATPIAPFVQQVIQREAQLSAPVVKAGNCAGAATEPFLPIPTPDDAKDASSALFDQGVDGAGKALDAASKAAKLSKGLRTTAKVGGKLAGLAGKGLAVHSAYKNMKEAGCLGGTEHP